MPPSFEIPSSSREANAVWATRTLEDVTDMFLQLLTETSFHKARAARLERHLREALRVTDEMSTTSSATIAQLREENAMLVANAARDKTAAAEHVTELQRRIDERTHEKQQWTREYETVRCHRDDLRGFNGFLQRDNVAWQHQCEVATQERADTRRAIGRVLDQMKPLATPPASTRSRDAVSSRAGVDF